MNKNEEDNYIFETISEDIDLPKKQEAIEDKPNISTYFFSILLLFVMGLNSYYGILWIRSAVGKLMIFSTILSLIIVLVIMKNQKFRKLYMLSSLTLIIVLSALFFIGFKDMLSNSYKIEGISFIEPILIGEPFAPEVYGYNDVITEFVDIKSEDTSFAKVVNGKIVVQKVGKGNIVVFDKYGNKLSKELEYLGIDAHDYTLNFRDLIVGETGYIIPVLFPQNANEILPTVEIINENEGLGRLNENEFIALKPGIVKIKTSHPRLGDKFFEFTINDVTNSIKLVVDENTAKSRVDGNQGEIYYADKGDIITVNLVIEPQQIKPSWIQWQFNDMTGQNTVGNPRDVNEVIFEFKGSLSITAFQADNMSNTIQIIERGR